MRKRHKVDPSLINRLKDEIESRLCRKMRTPADFAYLSTMIQSSDEGDYVSATTLKRLWGYINDVNGGDYNPSAFTIRALCRLLGHNDIDDFANAGTSQSAEYTGPFVETKSLPLLTEVTICWDPNRRCRLRHINTSLFKVIENEHSRLHVGDLVECGCFTQHAPAYFGRVFRAGSLPRTYVAGSVKGITFTIHPAAPSTDSDSGETPTDDPGQ